uniref:F-box domain-containing protein n=1 Tax=Panagrolaimus davidi TaxID=227884 RepID=A0A914PFM8_9BILA
MPSEDEAMMTQMPSTNNNFERRLEPIYLIQAFDHLLQLFHNQQLSYIGVNKTDIYKDIANLPVYLFYSNPDALLDELDGLCYLTKFLDAYKNGQKIVYRMNQNRLLNSIRRLLSLGSDNNDIYDIQNVIQKLGFLVFSLTDIVSFDLHDFNWQILLKMFEEIQKNSFIDGKMFYNTLNNDSKDFLIAHLLKPASLPSTSNSSNSDIPGTDFIPILPNELIIKIFSNLPGKDLLSCTGVSKQWRKYSQSKILWKNICNFDGVFENSFLPPFYKPRPQRAENSWLIGFGDKYFKEHAIEMPPRFYNRSSIMYFPAMDYFGLQWHNEMSQNECTKLISKWLRAQRIKQNWIHAKPTNIAEIFVHDDGPITCMDIKAGIIASGSDNRSLACFSMIDGRLKFYKKKAHGGGIWSIGINETGTWIASGATDRTVRVWKTDDGSLLKIFVGHANIVRTLKVVGDRIISGSRDKTVRIWNMESARSIILEHEVDGIRHIETGNGMIFSGGYEGTIKVWDIESGEFIQALEGHTGRITKMQFWNWKNAEQFYEILNHSKEISTMFLAPFNSLVTHDEKGNVHLWSTIDGKHLCTLYENNDVVNSRILQFGGSSTQLIIGTNRCDSTLLIALDFDFPNP